jgi:hypothetical protein
METVIREVEEKVVRVVDEELVKKTLSWSCFGFTITVKKSHPVLAKPEASPSIVPK